MSTNHLGAESCLYPGTRPAAMCPALCKRTQVVSAQQTPRDAPLQNTSKQHPLPPHATEAQAAMHALLLLPCKSSLRQLVRLSHEPVLLDRRCACMISPLGAPGASGQGALSKHISCQSSAMPRDAPWKCTLLTLKQHPLPPHDTKAQAAMQHWQCMIC